MSTDKEIPAAPVPTMRDRRGRAYVPAVGPWLRPLLWCILIGFAFLAATGVYLASVTTLTWWTGRTQTTYFYFFMFIAHIVLGVAILLPFVVFGFSHLVTSWKRPNKTAIRYGIILLVIAIVLLVSGVLLVRIGAGGYSFDIKDPNVRNAS